VIFSVDFFCSRRSWKPEERGVASLCEAVQDEAEERKEKSMTSYKRKMSNEGFMT